MWYLVEVAFAMIETSLIFYLFSKRLGYIKQKIAAALACFLLYTGVVFAKECFGLESYIAIPLIVATLILCATTAFSGSFSQKIYWALIAALIPMITEMLIFFVLNAIPGITHQRKLANPGEQRLTSLFIFILLCTLAFFASANIHIKKLEKLYYPMQYRLFIAILVLMCFLCTSDVMHAVVVAYERNIMDMMYILLRVAIYIILLFLVLVTCMAALGSMSRRETENKLYLNRQSYQNSYVKEIEQAYNSLRKQKHDMRDQLNIISLLLEQKNYDDLEEFFKQLNANYENINIIVATNNSTINACLSVKANEARRHGINFALKAGISKDLPISDLDLCTLLANLLNNAIDACLTIPEEENRFIRLEIFEKNSMFGIRITNSTVGRYKMINGELHSIKDGRDHGIGIPEMREIVNENKGFIEFMPTGTIFTVTVVIPISDKSTVEVSENA